MELQNRTAFTDIDHALEEAQFLVNTEKVAYCIVRARRGDAVKIYVVPADVVTEVEILETFQPV